MNRTIELADGEYIVTAYAERADGPGWSNQPVWVIIHNPRTPGNGLRVECLQPAQQTDGMRTLYRAAAAIQRSMVEEVNQLVKVQKPKTQKEQT